MYGPLNGGNNRKCNLSYIRKESYFCQLHFKVHHGSHLLFSLWARSTKQNCCLNSYFLVGSQLAGKGWTGVEISVLHAQHWFLQLE